MENGAVFFDSWTGLLRVSLVGIPAYVGLIVLLRASGKRTLTKMNTFDFVVTVALGSTLATILLSGDVALAEGLLALALLIFLQYLVAWLSVRFPVVRSIVASEPTMLVHNGELLRHAMRRERVSEGEVRQAMRNEGVDEVSGARAVVLESDGTFSIIKDS